MIKASNLTMVYGSGTCAAKDVSFEVRDGQIVGFAGPNGAGKTTVIKMITGIPASVIIVLQIMTKAGDSDGTKASLCKRRAVR